MTEYTPIDIDIVLAETYNAVLVGIAKRKCWIPKSQLEEDVDEDTEGPISVSVWFAEQEGLV